MNDLLNFIQKLSVNDKKTLSQKALKVTEETGELAKAVLPYDNAFATTHKFETAEHVLEEVVDVMLSAVSLAYDLKFSHEDIIKMLEKKSLFWAQLQAAENNLTYPLPFEIHITVEKPGAIDTFKDVCTKIGVKAIVLDLENQNFNIIDAMTSSVHYGDNRSAYEEAGRITRELQNYNYTVVRKKIETVPFHPAAPGENKPGIKMPKDCYFETHIPVLISKEQKDMLQELAAELDGHLSKNFFKKIENGLYVNMFTIRAYNDTYEIFLKRVQFVQEKLESNGFMFEPGYKTEIEFSIYDTKVSHDFQWLNKIEYTI
ncbi:MAG: hypothetical protein E6Q38_00920 [Crocinitomicaceae bacterium]|nr:MAG: hypothetical protein E6Q38_00920 [Crocinitomicaceae bacterium]